MKISDEKVRDYRDLLWCKTAVFRGEGLLTYAWIITKMNHDQRYLILSNACLWRHDLHPGPDPPEGLLLGILVWGVSPGSPNPDTISDQKMAFSTPIFRPDL